MTDRKWTLEALSVRAPNMGAIAQAHVDAGVSGVGWLRVDPFGSVERVNPNEVTVIYGAPKDGWIKCSERMPEVKTGVLVGCRFGREWTSKWATFVPGSPESQISGWIIPGASWNPTHWMPLPAAPKPEK